MIARSQNSEYRLVIREKTKQPSLLQDSELIKEDLEQLDREMKELTIEIKTLHKREKQVAIEELEILHEVRDDLAKGYSSNITRKTIYLKSKKLRIDENGQTDVTVYRFDKNLVWTIVPDKRGYIQSNLADFVNNRSDSSDYGIHEPLPQSVHPTVQIDSAIVHTDEKEEIHNQLCEQIFWISRTDTTEFWVTQDILPQVIFEKFSYVTDSDDQIFIDRIVAVSTNLNIFPVVSVNHQEDREHVIDIEEIQIGPLGNSLFEIPNGYKKLTINDLVDDDF